VPIPAPSMRLRRVNNADPGHGDPGGLARSLPKERVGDSSRRSRADRVDAPVRLDTVDVAGLLATQAIGLVRGGILKA
jgi:hypothetical protein